MKKRIKIKIKSIDLNKVKNIPLVETNPADNTITIEFEIKE